MFQDVVQHLIILACVCIIDEVCNMLIGNFQQIERAKLRTVTAHNTRNSGHDASQKRVCVNLVLSSIIDVGTFISPIVFLLAKNKVSIFFLRLVELTY